MASRKELYKDYVNELKMFNPNLIFMDNDSIFKQYEEVANFSDLTWIDIYDGIENVGFILLTNGSHCPVNYDWFIMECYIDPAHRRKHLMTKAMQKVIDSYDGYFGMFILAMNKVASMFWNSFIANDDETTKKNIIATKYTLNTTTGVTNNTKLMNHVAMSVRVNTTSVPSGNACYERAFLVQ